MATKYVCDRCGDDTAGRKSIFIVRDIKNCNEGDYYDLCAACLVDIRFVLERRP